MNKENKAIPGLQKLAQSEAIARQNARPEPIFNHPGELRPRTIIPSAAEIVDLKKLYGIKYLGEAGR